ncbi:MAG TPA: response regulator transcription factor, partial [Acidimicrobiales bacterium]|nr:response regulator transcription factor [Acidimicrobiales bacterium]
TLPLVVGDVAVDRARHRAWWQGTAVSLTPKEFDLLELLLAHAGQVLARAVLLRRVWGQATGAGNKTLEVHVSRLRTKVEEDPARPRRLLTVRGVGYRYRAVPSEAPGGDPGAPPEGRG